MSSSSDFSAEPASIPPRPAALSRTLSEGGGVSARALIGSNLIAEAMSLREMAPTAANALGRAMMGAVLIAVGPSAEDDDRGEDEGESVQLQFRGDGALGSVLAISDARGRVRGTVDHPEADLSLADGSPDVARAIGLGTLTVVRHKPGWREPYSGIVPLTSGEIAQDITLYLSESEQIPSAVGLGVAMANDESAVVAAGFLLQMLPGASEAEIAQAEKNVRAMPPPSDLALTGTDAGEILDLLLTGLGSRTHSHSQPIFYCPCTRKRALATLAMLEVDELQSIVREGIGQEVCCHFCARAYMLSPEEVGSLLGGAGPAR
ncbi:MAG: Hsp33 family molecular chaperone HslO [Myxococcota bacterium]|nr:Hsp33 family molecular chaperone HslO [Myxococcota bacterium]